MTEGQLRFRAATTPSRDVVLVASGVQDIPPGVVHEVQPLGSVRFTIDFFAVDRRPRCRGRTIGGGDPAAGRVGSRTGR